MNGHRFEAPLIAGINDAPCADDDAARAQRRRLALQLRPHAEALAQFVLAMQELECRPPPVCPADIKRRELSLKRADALAKSMPEGFPLKPPPVWTPGLDSYGAYNARRRPHGASSRRFDDVGPALDDDGDDEPAPRGRPRKPQPEPACPFPLTLAAAQALHGSAWNLGDAIIAECGPPGKNHIKTGSYTKVIAAQQSLADRGISYTFDYMIKLRDIAFAFPPKSRRYSFTVHIEARTPATLDAIEAGLPEGEAMTASYVRQQRRVLNGKTAPAPTPANATADTIAALMAPLVAALKMVTKAGRVSVIAGMMRALGLNPEDFAPAHRLAARRLKVPSPVPAVGRIAAVA